LIPPPEAYLDRVRHRESIKIKLELANPMLNFALVVNLSLPEIGSRFRD
jgi:hypothetical protein